LTPKKLGNKEQRELDSLPARIEALEQEQAALRAGLVDVNLYAKDPQRATALYQRDAAIDQEMLTALARWEELSGT
jgi:ATP-binding cassette subfamily F protein uup